MSSVLIKYSSPIEKRLEFYNDFWGKRTCIGSGSFQWTLSGSIHCAETWQEWCFFFKQWRIPQVFNLSLKGLLIRDEWNVTWDCAENACNQGVRNFIIVGWSDGHRYAPFSSYFLSALRWYYASGKTLSFYYILAMRLALGLTTFFQHTSDYVLLFDKSGVYHLASNLPWDAIQDLPTDHIAWVLVDSNMSVQNPAGLLFELSSPLFIMEASSPRRYRWGWVK